MTEDTRCSNDACNLRNRCKRFIEPTAPKTTEVHRFKPKRAGNIWVCDEYRYNGQTIIK